MVHVGEGTQEGHALIPTAPHLLGIAILHSAALGIVLNTYISVVLSSLTPQPRSALGVELR
jgi:hypothetical protein